MKTCPRKVKHCPGVSGGLSTVHWRTTKAFAWLGAAWPAPPRVVLRQLLRFHRREPLIWTQGDEVFEDYHCLVFCDLLAGVVAENAPGWNERDSVTERTWTCPREFKTSDRVDLSRGFSQQRLDGDRARAPGFNPFFCRWPFGVLINRKTCLRGCEGVSVKVSGKSRELSCGPTWSPMLSTRKALTSMPGLAAVKIPDGKWTPEKTRKTPKKRGIKPSLGPKVFSRATGKPWREKRHFAFFKPSQQELRHSVQPPPTSP